MKIIEDKREIRAVWQPDETSYKVGEGGVTRIKPYREDGGLGPTAWLKVEKGCHLFARINCAHVESIFYKDPDPTDA